MLVSMRDLERTWNSKFNYPWTFFNDVPFSEDFKRLTQMETKAKCSYGTLSVSPLTPASSPTDRLSSYRINSQRALGSTLVDQQRPL